MLYINKNNIHTASYIAIIIVMLQAYNYNPIKYDKQLKKLNKKCIKISFIYREEEKNCNIFLKILYNFSSITRK